MTNQGLTSPIHTNVREQTIRIQRFVHCRTGSLENCEKDS